MGETDIHTGVYSAPQRLVAQDDQAALRAELERVRERLSDQLRNAGHMLDTHENERRRIADRLHDEAAQTMAAALLAVGLLERGATAELTQCQLEQVRRRVHDCLVDLRELASSLRPASLEELGLLPALERISELERERASRSITFTYDGVAGRLPTEVETSAYRVIEEMLCALNTVASLRVSLLVENDTLRVAVRSCGQGTRSHLTADDKLDRGLATARARLELIGGTLLLDWDRNDNIGLIAEIPLAWTPSGTHTGVSVGGAPLERLDQVSAGR